MKKTFEQLIVDFMDREIIESESHGENEVALNLVDVNLKILDMSWEDKLRHYLKFHKHEVTFSYGDGNWVTVHKIN